MEIKKHQDKEIFITGEIRNMTHYRIIKEAISESIEKNSRELTIVIEDSYAITSLVVGYLMKIIHQDRIKVTLKIKNPKLVKNLKELRLIEHLNVTPLE